MEFEGTNPNNNNNNNININAGQREQNHYMPVSNLIRIMRSVLPSDAQISDAALETMQKCVSEYISFITGAANEHCQSELRRTVTADDIIWAMRRLGFDNYIEPLALFMRKYREAEGNRQAFARGGPLPAATRFGSGASPMLQQPAPPLMSSPPNPTAGAVNPTSSMNASPQPLPLLPPPQQEQEHGANEGAMAGYYIGAYEDEYGGSSSTFDLFLPYREG